MLLASIVATMLYFPIGLLLMLAFRLFGVAFEAFVSFGGAVSLLAGLAAWWLIFFAGSFIYAACLFPWGEHHQGWENRDRTRSPR